MSELTAWRRAFDALGVRAPTGALERLIQAYEEPARAYHTRTHLRECFACLETVESHARRLPEVQLAIWFHDAVYDTRASDNEERSADEARTTLLDAGASEATAERVHALVLATRHSAVPASDDERLVVDVDLAILGAPPERFDEYEAQIRQEYAWVAEKRFREGRARILHEFAARPAIFSTPTLAKRLERRARENIARSLRRLGGNGG